MKVYTKGGDKGLTSLLGGTRVPKNSVRLDAYGTVDELNTYLGMVRSFDIDVRSLEELVAIQTILFSVGGNLATDTSIKDLKVKVVVKEEDIEFLEKAIDHMDESLPPLSSFVLPGGNQVVSFCHIARTVCRRAERRILDLGAEAEVNDLVIKYINRLSDYLFVLSRKVAHDLGIEEIKWVYKP